MKVTQDQAWYWLTNTERTVLQDFNPDAQKIVNELVKPDDLLHTETRPYPSSGKLWLPEKHIIVCEHSRRMVQIHHPLNPDFTKMDYRDCVVFKERSQYGLGATWVGMVRACMTPGLLKALTWDIYDASYTSMYELYLRCDIPGPSNHKHVQLYVPSSYFRTKDWSVVEKRHTEAAVNYYRNGNFGESVAELAKTVWADKTAAALTCLEAKVLRAIVENTL